MQFKNGLFRIAGFLAGLIIILLLMGVIFSAKRYYPTGYIQDRNSRHAMLTCEKPEQVDIINVGDSESGTGFSPMAVWEQRGYTSMNIGCDGITMPEAYIVLRKMFRTQSPKVVLLETNLFYRNGTAKLVKSLVAEEFYDLFEGLRFHNLWKFCWRERDSRLLFKGYIINEFVAPYTDSPDYMKPTDQVDHLDFFSEKWMAEINKLCKKNGAELVLWSCASPENYWMAKHNGLQEGSDKNGLTYLDCNLNQEAIGLDWSHDTSDAGNHMNCFGAEKTALWLVDSLDDRIDFTDRRQDPAFADEWNPILDRYKETKVVMDGYYTDIISDEIADYIQNGGDFHQPGY